jgi:cell division initiation protein
MSLSPNDIRTHGFHNQMRGYDKEAVDNFKEEMAAALETARQENLKLSMEIESLKSQLAGMKQFEDTIKNAAIDARRNADQTVAAAKKEAETMIVKARKEADQELAVRAAMLNQIEEQITKIGLSKKSYLAKVRSMIQSHLDLIDEIGGEPRDRSQFDEMIEVTDSKEVDAKVRETVATRPSGKPLKTEDAGEPGSVAANLSDSAKTDLAKALKGALHEDEPKPPEPDPFNTPGIDPELAAALASYKNLQKNKAVDDAPRPTTPPPPVVETSARAEDIPDGFIAREPKPAREQGTQRVSLPDKSTSLGVEHNTIDIDTPADAKQSALSPENLAGELDQVVAKFEEEMDKAAKAGAPK